MLYGNFKAIKWGVKVVWDGHWVKHPYCWRPSDLLNILIKINMKQISDMCHNILINIIMKQISDIWFYLNSVIINYNTWYLSQDCSAQLMAATLTWGCQSVKMFSNGLFEIFILFRSKVKASKNCFSTFDIFSKCLPKGSKSLTMSTPISLYKTFCVERMLLSI